MAAAGAPNTLSREVLRWIQSMDLAYSVKNPRRDFASGFLLAELLSRHFESDITMHSYSNGTSLAQKRNNFEQISKFLKKRGIKPGGQELTQQEINDVMQCKAGAAVEVVNRFYTFLTGRKVQPPPARPTDDYVPAFAKPTAAHAIRETMRDPGVEAITDLSTKESKMREALSQHQLSLAEEKLKDPGRYAVKRGPKVVRGATRTVGQEESKSSVEIKQVAVKSVDSSVAHLRATKELQASAARLTMGAGGSSIRGLADYEAAGVQPALETLNTCVQTAFTGHDAMSAFNPGLPPAIVLVECLVSGNDFPHGVAADVFRSIGQFANVTAIVDACLLSPRDFFQVAAVLQPTVGSVPESSPAFGAACDAFVAIGKAMVAKDVTTSVKLFRDFALPSFVPIIKRRPTKRHAILRLLYAFSPATATGRLQAIRTLQESLDDLPVFLHCLTVLIFLEDSFDEDLLDLYLYYCLIGMGMTSPSLRAACVAMLSVIAVHNSDLVVGVVDRLLLLRSDTWWEVKAQLLIVCSALLDRMSPAVDGATVNTMLDLVKDLMHPDCGSVVLRVGVAYLAKPLGKHPSLVSPYLTALLALPREVREQLLDSTVTRNELPVVSASGGKYRLPCPCLDWPADSLIRGLVKMVQRESLEHLEVEHYQLLSALLTRQSGTPASASVSPAVAKEVVDELQNHVLVGICDFDCCALALETLKQFMHNGIGPSLLGVPTLQGTLLLLHKGPDGEPDPDCLAMMSDFLSETAQEGDDYAGAVADLLGQFRSAQGALLADSPLAGLASTLGV